MPVNYSKRRERTREISIDLGDGDTLKATYRPTRLTLSLLQELEESEKGATTAAGEDIGDADRERQWTATAEALCKLVVSWDLTDVDKQDPDKVYTIPVKPEALRESDFDILDMLAIIKAIQEDAAPDPPTAGT